MKDLKKMTPAEVLAHEHFAVMYMLDGECEWLHSAHIEYMDAVTNCDALNADRKRKPYIVVEIDHDALPELPELPDLGVIDDGEEIDELATVDLSGEVVDDGEKDAMLGALRYAYQMLDEGELEPSDILQRLRGYCEASGLVEFA